MGLGEHERSRRPSEDTEAPGTTATTGQARRKGGQAGNGARVWERVGRRGSKEGRGKVKTKVLTGGGKVSGGKNR